MSIRAFVYDNMNKWGKADDFFLSLIKSIEPKSVADLGCGTGRVTLEIAKLGCSVTAIDPNKESIACAKEKQGANGVSWVIGDSQNLVSAAYDTVIMTANVAQVFITEESWKQTLQDVYRALKPGGHFIFDTRNPNEKVWESWMQDDSVDEFTNDNDVYATWDEYDGIQDNVFTFHTYYEQKSTHEVLKDTNQLIFRTYDEIFNALNETGFSMVSAYGDWELQPATKDSKSFIVECVK